MNRSDVLISAGVHAAIVVALVVVRPVSTVSIPGPDAVQVALVDASQLPQPRVAPAVPREAPAPVAQEEGVRIERRPRETPRETPRREEPPRPTPPVTREPEPAAPSPAQAPAALPYAPTGVAGLSGQVGVDQADFAFSYYLVQVRQAIAANWTAPAGVPTGTRAVVRFRILRDGTVRDARLAEGSGNSWFDQSAARAVAITRRLPPLPAGYGGGELGVQFGFEYTGN